MIIRKIDSYKDGGTLKITTDSGIYCIDRRIKSSTVGDVYHGYPEDNESNKIMGQASIKQLIKDALDNYKPDRFNYKPVALELLNKE